MKFYTSVLPYRGRLLVRGVNHDGSHKKFRINYKPSLFVPSGKESEYKTLDGRDVGQVTFESMPEAKKWIDQYKDVSGFEYYGNTRYQYPFIADEFRGKIDWDIKQIRILTIDIECESENGFPNVEKANEALICITVKDHTSKRIIVFGMENFVNDRDDVQYIKCKSEIFALCSPIKVQSLPKTPESFTIVKLRVTVFVARCFPVSQWTSTQRSDSLSISTSEPQSIEWTKTPSPRCLIPTILSPGKGRQQRDLFI